MLAVAFTQFTVGNLLTIAIIVGGGVTGYFKLRGVRADELTKTVTFWREEAEGLSERFEVVAKERDEQRALKHQALTELAAERLKRDQSIVLSGLSELHTSLVADAATNREGMLKAIEVLAQQIDRRFDESLENQQTMAETLQGLLHGVSDLNKAIRRAA